MTRDTNMEDENIIELEEGDDLELPQKDPVIIQTDSSYESQYKSLEELGKGKFGVVNKCRRKTDGVILAAKFVRKTASSKQEVMREIEMMNCLHHKRLIQLFDAFETPKEMVVIMELVTGGELFEKVVEEDNLTEKQVVRYMKQVLYGVQHMHRQQMVHLDLKPENILCLGGEKPGYEEIKLIDFGMTRILKDGEQESAMCGTPEFVAPEVITFNPITVQSDMWSIGVITYVLLSGLSPFMGDDDSETLKNVAAGEYDFEDDDEIFENLSDEVKQFIEELLLLNPQERLTIDESLQHAWTQGGGSDKKIATTNLKKFIARRRWQRTMNTIKAVSRLAGGLSLFGKKPGSHGLGKGGFLEKVKRQQSIEAEADAKKLKDKEEAECIKKEEEKEKQRLKEEEKRAEEEQTRKRKESAEKKRKQEEEEKKRKQEEEKKRKASAERKRRQDEEKKQQEKERERKEQEEKEEEQEEKQKREKEKQRKEDEEKKEQEAAAQKQFSEEERKRKRDAERKRRQDERKRVQDENTSPTEAQTTNTNTLHINGTDSQNTIILNAKNDEMTEKILLNGSISKNNNNNTHATTDSPKNSTQNNPKPSPSVGRRETPKTGSVTNRIAAFQQGDIYWKNKKK